MSDKSMPEFADGKIAESFAHVCLMREIEDFIYLEADVLDDREFERWLDFFSEDLHYWMPIRKNLPFRQKDKDITDENDVAWFEDDKVTLTKRVRQIMTGIHWAEEPLSRVTHLISNIRLAGRESGGEGFIVRSHFLVHRNRLEQETDFITGRREDLIRRANGSFLIHRRKIIIDQSVLLAKNLTFFF
jgi:3-phenylpropionate/cinnamic acid dioxygenase small subunit